MKNLQHEYNSMLLPFEKVVFQSKYKETFLKSFEDIVMEFTKIMDYSEPYNTLSKLNQNLLSLLQKFAGICSTFHQNQ